MNTNSISHSLCPSVTHTKSIKLMGNRFEISVVSDNEAWANDCIAVGIAEIQRIEKLLTTFSDTSQTQQINAQAGIAPVRVDTEVFALIQRAIKISDLTQGAFDISYGSLDKRFWNFDTNMKELPNPKLAKKAVHLINYKNIILNQTENSVFLREKGMRIGFGGIGKGYAADCAKLVMQQFGAKSGIVNASGDLVTWGHSPEGKAWTIGIVNPNQQNKAFSHLAISNMAVATSGNYEKYAIINGKKYGHTIDPKTGFPISGVKSVTIISPNAEIADAMATPIQVMGIKVGLNLINQIRYLACIIVSDDNKIYTSDNIKVNF